MKKSKKLTTNTTLLRLKGTPFHTAAELKKEEDRILMDEWRSIERARVRRELLMKDQNQKIIAPFYKGFKANFVEKNMVYENLVRVYLTEDESIGIDIQHEKQNPGSTAAIEILVKSLVEGFVSGYLAALGLKEEGIFRTAQKDPSN